MNAVYIMYSGDKFQLLWNVKPELKDVYIDLVGKKEEAYKLLKLWNVLSKVFESIIVRKKRGVAKVFQGYNFDF